MANLIRWDPFSEFTPLRQMMDRLLEDAWVRPGTLWSQVGQAGFGPFACDMYETDEDYVVTAALPGLKPEDLEITVQGNMLTISGEVKPEEHADEKANYHVRERRYGKFFRQIALPAGIEGDRVQAHLENGVLTLTVPKAEELKPRRIQIQAGTTPQIVSGERVAA